MDVHPPKNGINRYWSIPLSLLFCAIRCLGVHIVIIETTNQFTHPTRLFPSGPKQCHTNAWIKMIKGQSVANWCPLWGDQTRWKPPVTAPCGRRSHSGSPQPCDTSPRYPLLQPGGCQNCSCLGCSSVDKYFFDIFWSRKKNRVLEFYVVWWYFVSVHQCSSCPFPHPFPRHLAAKKNRWAPAHKISQGQRHQVKDGQHPVTLLFVLTFKNGDRNPTCLEDGEEIYGIGSGGFHATSIFKWWILEPCLITRWIRRVYANINGVVQWKFLGFSIQTEWFRPWLFPQTTSRNWPGQVQSDKSEK